MSGKPILHFVYNVDANPIALVMDFAHRITSPETYPCRLCDLTYGRFLKKRSWNSFVARLPVGSRFHLRNAFHRRFPELRNVPVPALFVEAEPGKLRLAISSEKLQGVADLEQLEKLVTQSVEQGMGAWSESDIR